MDEKTRRWFVDRVAQDPDYIDSQFLPAIEKLEDKALSALFQAIRTDTVEKIKYRMGWLDGVHEAISLLDGLKMMADARKPPEAGLMSRIFGNGQISG